MDIGDGIVFSVVAWSVLGFITILAPRGIGTHVDDVDLKSIVISCVAGPILWVLYLWAACENYDERRGYGWR